MKFLDKDIQPLGMGCWPIGGAMYNGDQIIGYSNSDDVESIRTIHAALDAGITLFDTAAAYGAGHSERLLAQALKDRPDAAVVTKIGIRIDEDTKRLFFEPPLASDVEPALDACLRRLAREKIDLLLLHPNETTIADAAPLFDAMERARMAGKITAYGWSTDFSDNVRAMADRPGFKGVQLSMNVFFDAPRIQVAVEETGMLALIRSPLAMGILSGKYGAGHQMPSDDIRSAVANWMEYFKDGQPNPEFLAKLDAVRELLTTGGRSLVQGALCWLWGKRAENIPIPGARTVEQIEGIAGALAFGPLPENVMVEIDQLIPRTDMEERPR